MSYILDALRRANSERERGSVPTLSSDPGPADRAGDEEEASTSVGGARAMPWLAGGLGAALVALAALWLWPKQPEPVTVVTAQTPPVIVPQAPQPVPTTVAPAPAQVATVPLTVPPLIETAPAPAPAASAATVNAAPPKPAVAAERPVPTKAELPEDLRRLLPPLVTGGAMYFDTPANRMVIINGQVFHEGDKLMPDLVLEQIMLKGAVLSFKGQRFSISF